MQNKPNFELDGTDSVAIYGYIFGIFMIAVMYLTGLLA